MKLHIESMYCIETGRRWKMKNPEIFTDIIDQLYLRSTRQFWKCSENENFPFSKCKVFSVSIFSKTWNLPKTLKILIFVLYFITYIQNRGNGNSYLNLVINLNIMRYFFLKSINDKLNAYCDLVLSFFFCLSFLSLRKFQSYMIFYLHNLFFKLFRISPIVDEGRSHFFKEFTISL